MQLKERGREKLYPSTAAVTNPNGGRQSMVKVDRSFSVVVNAQADARRRSDGMNANRPIT